MVRNAQGNSIATSRLTDYTIICRPFTRDVVNAMTMRIQSLEAELAKLHLEKGSQAQPGPSDGRLLRAIAQ